MATHTVTADDAARGWILIKDGPLVITSIWSFDIMSVGMDPKGGRTQISMRDVGGLWHATSASVADVHRAVSAARVLFNAGKDAPTANYRRTA